MLTRFVQIGILWLNLSWALCNIDLTLGKCDTQLSVLDFFVLLQWNCTGLMPNTTFRVEIKMQNEYPSESWRTVAQCDKISSLSCDLSREITEITLHHVRLGVEEWHGHVHWMCNLSYDPTNWPDLGAFSAPSLSLRVEDRGRDVWTPHIVVEVKFPCAPEVLCQVDSEGCCSVLFILSDISAVTVTLFNRQRPTERETRTGSVSYEDEDKEFSVEFGGLVPGQEYCVVATFRSSATSQPVCQQLNTLPVDLRPILLGTALSVCFFIPLVVAYLKRRKTHTSEYRLPRSLAGLLEPASGLPVPVVAAGVLSAKDSPSIISLCSCDFQPTATQLPAPSPGQHQYYSSAFPKHPPWDARGSGSGGSVPEGLEVPQTPLFRKGSWDSEVQTDRGPQHGEGFTSLLDGVGIPLSSLRLGMGEEGDWVYLHEGLMVQSGCEISTRKDEVDMYHGEMEGVGDIS
ncbi:uncharacterized protein LOC121689784 isoform X1 [Alosa sapidissima]|uniref:uncharacterized protein LOC121689784 isoform X1 n=1 Tax=Alosa sapidissima TaxID=34773 RepID=UPI001C0988A3|nr:uncharacterized protein LOC121689784 isoform X1 [Alosa sapidissima]